MRIVQVNPGVDEQLKEPEELLARCFTLTGWSEALVEAGARSVGVVQRFHRDATIVRNGVRYLFRRRGVAAAVRHGAVPDLVHVNGLIFPACVWRLRRALPDDRAIVVQDHGNRLDAERRGVMRGVRHALWRRGLRSADAFIFTAADQDAPWRRADLIGAGQAAYHALEAGTAFRAAPRAAARQATGVSGSPALLWVGRLDANKDPLTVLSGFERALAMLPNARLTMIYGEDTLLADVKARIAASSALDGRVRLAGAVPHERMPQFYSAADIFVAGSHHEGSGYALLEACACGAVPVVTDIPSFAAITANGSLGATWTPGDADGFARALAEVSSRDLAALGRRVSDYADRAFRWPAVGRRAIAIYRDVIARRRARPNTRPAA